jgi:2-oxoisovalerate dehydrogenase E2 component (dihydrolipoyl transacylase)
MDFVLPELGEGIYEAELVRWYVRPGDVVKRSQPLLEVMTDKATMDVPAPFSGKLLRVTVQPGNKVKIGEKILSFEPTSGKVEAVAETKVTSPSPVPSTASTMKSPPSPSSPAPTTNGQATPEESPVAAPSVRHFARKLGIDLSRIQGTGPAGRILLDDLAPYLARAGDKTPLMSDRPVVDYGKPGMRIKMQGVRRKIAEHMVEASTRIPHFSYIDECDVTDLVKLRQQLREPAAKLGIKLTYLPFFIKAVVLALQEIPIINSSLDEEKQEIVLHDRYHIGLAVATPTGLIVPVIHDADRRDLFEIAAEIERLGQDARVGKVKLEDIRGGTFTVTSIGNIGGLISTPIINSPEAGIMGVGQFIRRPVYDSEDRIRPADLVYLSYSFDHRILDGAVGAAFGNIVKKHLQNPATLLLPVRR